MTTGAVPNVSINAAVPSSISLIVLSGRAIAATRSAITARIAVAIRAFLSTSSTTMKSQPWLFPGLGARVAAHITRSISSEGTGSGFR